MIDPRHMRMLKGIFSPFCVQDLGYGSFRMFFLFAFEGFQSHKRLDA